jgi:hypothetical protein
LPQTTQILLPAAAASPAGDGISTAVSDELDEKQVHGGPASVVSVAPTTPPQSGHNISPAIDLVLRLVVAELEHDMHARLRLFA